MKHSEIQDAAMPKNGLDHSRQNHSEDKEGDKENQKTEVESLNDNQSTLDVILLDEYDYNIELEGKLLSQEKDLKISGTMSTYCGMIVSKIEKDCSILNR